MKPHAFTIATCALLVAPAMAHADAHEASVHSQAIGGVVRLEDPDAVTGPSSAAMAGLSGRFTWATRNWLAWEAEAYGAAVGASDHMTGGADPLGYQRGAIIGGADAGATLRLGSPFGYAIVPTISAAAGPHLRMFRRTPQFRMATIESVRIASSKLELDLAARLSAGIDARLGKQWLVGSRISGRQSLGLMGSPTQSIDFMIHASFYWYPRWWTF